MANAKSSKAAPAATTATASVNESMKVGIGQQFDSELPDDAVHRCVVAEIVDQGWEHKFNAWTHSGFIIVQLDQTYTGDGDLADVPMEVRIWFEYEREDPRFGEEMQVPGVGTIKVSSVGLGSLKKGTKLKKRLEEMRGALFTASDYERIAAGKLNIGKLIGREYRVQTSVTTKNGKTFADIVKMMPKDPKSTAPPMEITNYTPFHEREARDAAKSGSGVGQRSASSGGGASAGGDSFFDDDASAGGDDDDSVPF
jgi:hypothetical protein